MAKVFWILIAGSISIGAMVWAVSAWRHLPGGAIGTDGMMALSLGIMVTIIVGVGLMGLMFFSSRRGFDAGGSPVDPPNASPGELRSNSPRERLAR